MSTTNGTLTTGALALVLLASLPALALESACRQGCAAGTVDCTRIPGSAIGFDLRDPLAALHRALTDLTRQRIPQSEMLGMFGLSNDPCDRSATTLGQTLRNEGESCILLTTYTSELLGEVVDVRVAMPSVLNGTLERNGRAAVINFAERRQAPYLDLDDPLLADLLGGRVERVEFFEDATFALIDAADGSMCVELYF